MGFDVDANDQLTYSITTVSTPFGIVSTTGRVFVKNASLNFERTQSYIVTIRVTDSGNLFASAPITVAVLNVNDPPFFAGTSVSIAENSADGSNIGPPLSAVDEDLGEIFSWTVVSGGDGVIGIHPTTGQLTQLAAALDFEATRTYVLTVQVHMVAVLHALRLPNYCHCEIRCPDRC
jgi:hypothetical protein